MSLEQFEIYIHTDVDITTIDELLNEKSSLFSSFVGKKQEFLDYDGGTDITNTQRVLEKYTDTETEDYANTNNLTILKPNTTLIIPKTLLNKELQSIRGANQFLKQTGFKSFFAKSLIQLLKDPLYKKKDTYKIGEDEILSTIHPNISVWIYSSALGEILNLSKFIQSCSINVGNEGGTFSISLPGIVDLNNNIDEFDEQIYSSNFVRNNVLKKDSVYYFHQYIQENDIVFIKFEKLSIETDNKLTDFRLNKSVLAGQVYDMIGLVNSNSISTNYVSNDVSINVSGNDLMKLLIDDGSYFFPLLFIGDSSDTFVNLQDDDKLIKRVFATGTYNSLFAYSYRSISDTAQFIMNQLANIGIVDESVDLFSSYGQRRTKVYRLDNEKQLKDELHKGVWQIIKLLVDENIADRRVADSSLSQPDGSLIVQFQKICQFPFVEFFGDTYADTYNLIVRQPPFTKSQIISFLDGSPNYEITNKVVEKQLDLPQQLLKSVGVNVSKEQVDLVLTVNPEDIMQEDLDWEGDELYSWYELRANGNFLGNTNDISLAFLPIVYFPQYANKWGCKKMGVVSNYISYRALTGKDTDGSRDLFREALINDYKFLIDSFSYLPFTRKGRITMIGDRRFKRGTWIRHGGTGEIFYVNSISNDYSIGNSIDRTTVLEVSRGMVEKYVKGYNGLSYFNIINTDFIRDVLLEKLKANGTSKNKPRVNVKSNFGVNQTVFDFFYSRSQMDNIL